MKLSTELPRIYQRIVERGDRDRLFGNGALQWMGSTSEFAAAVEELRALGGDPHKHLLLLLKTLSQQEVHLTSTRAQTALVATDPSLAGSGVRFTESVLREMCESARQEVLVAGFAIAVGGGLETHLMAAAARGCRVSIISGAWKKDDGTGLDAILRAWPSHLTRPQCFIHEKKKNGDMHIKALIVDGLDMLIGSANFTLSAIKNNYELGLRVRGNVALEAKTFLETISRSNAFTRI